MEVKIYREPENENLIIDENQLEEYNSLAGELGLGPIKDGEKSKTPVVYPYLKKSMEVLLKCICPCEVDIKGYKKSTIPLEVLKVYKFCIDNEMFEKYMIWYDDSAPDPMLIGKKYENDIDRKNGYSWNMNSYLIARWGDCAMELEALLKKGNEILKENISIGAKSALTNINDIIENPEKYLKKALDGNSITISIINTNGTLPF